MMWLIGSYRIFSSHDCKIGIKTISLENKNWKETTSIWATQFISLDLFLIHKIKEYSRLFLTQGSMTLLAVSESF